MENKFDFREFNNDQLKPGFYSYGSGYVHYNGSAPTDKLGEFTLKVIYRDTHGELPCFLTERATRDLKPVSDIPNLVARLKKDEVLFFKKCAQSSAKSTGPCSPAELYRLRNSGGSCSNNALDK